MLIAVEGIDGSGKGTQTALLAERLRESGLQVTALSFPRYGTNPFAQAIAGYLNGEFGPAPDVSPRLAALLYAGDRFCNKAALVSPTKGAVVVCDRYVDSNIAHQGAKLAPSEWQEFFEWLEGIEYGSYGLPRPELTILLRLPVETAVSLIAKKSARSYTELKADAHEADHGYLARCADVFDRLADRDTANYATVQCFEGGSLLTPDTIASKVWELVAARLRALT